MKIPFKLRVLLWIKGQNGIGTLDLSPEENREINRKELKKLGNLIDFPPIKMTRIRNREIEMRDGHKIPIRIYNPSEKTDLPLIVYYHGGGFVLRDIDSHDRVCRRVAKVNEAVVVSVGYRLAPEWKFPTPHRDCFDATVWASENAKNLDANPEKLIVMGDSAGGNLATVVSKLARNTGSPKIAAQVLVYPTADARLNHPSIEKYAEGYLLTKELIQWFVNHYKNKDEDVLDPNMSPLLEKDLSNMPPAFILTAEFDPLKDEGKAYADKLKAAGNEVVYKDYGGMVHAFFNLPRLTKRALTAHEDIRVFLAERF